jgi:hypothetical protein
VLVALPDPAAQRWLIPFFRSSTAWFFPRVDLNVADSSPRRERAPLPASYLLHWKDAGQDVVVHPSLPAVWQNRAFALTPLAACRDFTTFGAGWYRKEDLPASPLEWQRRFRWLRKRGEMLILNPTPRPKRLLVSMAAGAGNPSPVRHVEFFLNGERFDQARFSGQTRTLTRPFTASGPWSQIEIAVREDAAPQPRRFALWNRWVPHDARRLNLAVSELTLLDAGQEDSLLETALEFGPGKQMAGLVEGIYGDGWAGGAAEMILRVPPAVAAVEISGLLPRVTTLRYPYPMSLSINGAALSPGRIAQPGDFHLTVPVGDLKLKAGQAARLRLGPLPTFHPAPLHGDARALSVSLRRVALVGFD